MDLIADILLAAGALGAAIYCFVLGRRLKKFNDLEKGIGGAVAVLSSQVEDLRKALTEAQDTAAVSADTLTKLNYRAKEMSHRLELQMAALHDLPDAADAQASKSGTGTEAVANSDAADAQITGARVKSEEEPEVAKLDRDASRLAATLSKVATPPGAPMFKRHSSGMRA